MHQDTDIARMAAALRTPSIRYRSFGNEAVRNPPPAPLPSSDRNFHILGDALAGAYDLSPDVVLGDHRGASVRASDACPGMSTPPAAAGSSATIGSPPRPVVPSVSELPDASLAAPPFERRRPRPRGEPLLADLSAAPAISSGSTLLQALLGNVSQPSPPAGPCWNAASSSVAAAPGATSPAPGRRTAPPADVPIAAPVLSGLGQQSPNRPAPRVDQAGAALLDTLAGAPPAAGVSRYPLLDALDHVMRGIAADPGPWPAARVDTALPDLLRRVAAGVRASQHVG